MPKSYNTDQRKRVIDFFKENKEHHFTVNQIADRLCLDGSGRSTVYRQISNLLESGVIRRFESGDSRQFVYQFADLNEDCDSHYHLKCVKCGRLIHMNCERLKEVSDHIKSEHDFILGSGRGILYGECVDCLFENR